MEELQARHRKELRELQNKITQKKKQASKKTRKGVNDECDRLEAELKAQQQEEIASINSDGAGTEPPVDQLEDLTLQVDEPEKASKINGSNSAVDEAKDVELDPNEPVVVPSQARKPNRAKARLAKRAAEQEEVARQAAEEAKNLPDLKEQERERMNSAMKERGLQEKIIRADGHCLYSAFADQLDQLEIPLGTAPSDQPSVLPYKTVRAAAASYIEQHQDDFVPFLEEPLPDYVHKVRDTGEWGGQLELMALAKTYGVDINVLQDFGRVEKIESGESKKDGKSIWLGYYKHGFGLGEHYNSLRQTSG